MKETETVRAAVQEPDFQRELQRALNASGIPYGLFMRTSVQMWVIVDGGAAPAAGRASDGQGK